MDWKPALYEQFRSYRERPAADLLAAVAVVDPALIYDLGCGTGRITRQLAERYPDAEVVGIDNSPTMVDRDAAEDPPNLRFKAGDIATWSPPVAPDMIFSNAALHWLPDHSRLFPRLVGALAPGGYLYVQMPATSLNPITRPFEMSSTTTTGRIGSFRCGPGPGWVFQPTMSGCSGRCVLIWRCGKPFTTNGSRAPTR